MATYDPIRKVFLVPADDLEAVIANLRMAMREIRRLANLPLDKYERQALLTPPDHAQRSLIEVANYLGIDMDGARWGNEIDLREIS